MKPPHTYDSISIDEKIDDLKSKILKAKKEKIHLKGTVDLAKGGQFDNPYRPSQYDVEVWEKYGERWPDPELIKKYGVTIQRNWKRLEWEDWIRFFTWLIPYKNRLIERWKLEIEKIKRDQEPTKELRNSETIGSDDINQLIEKIARRRSRGKYSNDYQTIVDALSLYHENTDMFDYEVAEKAGVPPSTFNTWKKELEEKLV